MALHQFHTAQNFSQTMGHATRAGLTSEQAEPTHYDFNTFPHPPKFENKLEEREYLKGRLAAAFRIFAKQGFDEGAAGHITLRVRLGSCHPIGVLTLLVGSGRASHHVGQSIRRLLPPDAPF
jgi:hypothetical protein